MVCILARSRIRAPEGAALAGGLSEWFPGKHGSIGRRENREKTRGRTVDGCSVREREKGIGKNKNGDNFGGRVFEMVICFVSIVFLSLNYSFKNCIISSNYTCVYL